MVPYIIMVRLTMGNVWVKTNSSEDSPQSYEYNSFGAAMSMTPVQKAIADVRRKIPPQILQVAFMDQNFGPNLFQFAQSRNALSLDAMIREKIVEGRVMEDCNMLGGTLSVISLAGLEQEYYNQATIVVRIPMERTQNRRIVRALSVLIGLETLPSSYNYGMSNYSDMLSAAGQVVASHTSMPVQSTARVQLIAENTVMIADQSILPSTMQLMCMVENDLDFSQMRSMTISKFTRLVEYAVKAHIYNELVIPIAEGEMRGGMDLGRFKEIVDGYADAEENYETYREEVWIKVQMLDDFHSRNRHLRQIMGGGK